jgi:tetratricopeptide (TPR) repeat protein
MAKKRISRARKRDLDQPDEFITFWTKLFQFCSARKAQLSYVFGGIFVLLIIITGVIYHSIKSENKAFALFQQGIDKYQSITKREGPDKAYFGVKEDFQLIIEKYAGRKGTKLATFVYANICYAAKNYDKAIELYNQSLEDYNDDPFIHYLVLNSLGYSYKVKKDYKAAIKYFEMIASTPDAVLKDEALFNLGELYAKTGFHDKSIEMYKKIISDHSDSMYIEIVKERITG